MYSSASTYKTDMEQNTELTVNTPKPRVKPPRRKMVFNLIFGIIALLFAMAAATFASIMSLMGFSVIFTEKGLVPMATCLISAYLNAIPAVICGILSQKCGMVSGLNKVSIALSIASSAAGTVIFLTLALAVIADNAGLIF